jgi:cytochrome c2
MKPHTCLYLVAALMLSGCSDEHVVHPMSASGDIERGRIALTQYACHACHIIPGITGSRVYVGPPLSGLAKRSTLVGQLPNTADNLMLWIRDPHSVDPHTAMPDLGVSEQHARDMVAYLNTLK